MRKKAWLKILCLYLCFAVLLSFGGCSGGEEGNSSADESSVTESSVTLDDRLNALDKLDGKYAGKEYKIVTTSMSLFKSEGEGETPLDKAVNKRYQLIAQSLDIAITVREMTESQIENALKSNTLDAHLVCASSEFLAKMANRGYLENMSSLPYFDRNASYAPVKEIKAQTVSGKLFTVASPATLSLSSAVVIFYDKALLNAVGADPVQAVNNGTWTWDTLIDMAESTVNAGAKEGIASLSDADELIGAVYTSSGNGFISTEYDTPEIAYSSATASAVSRIYERLFDNEELCTNAGEDEALKSFINGNTAFLVARLDNVVKINGDDGGGKLSEWGVVPMPKHSEAQASYYSPVSSVAAVAAVPKGCDDSAFAGYMLNALFAASTENLDTNLKSTYINYYFWSNDSAVMLDLIDKTLFYDIGILFSSIQEINNIAAGHLQSKDALYYPEDDDIDAFNDRVNELFG